MKKLFILNCMLFFLLSAIAQHKKPLTAKDKEVIIDIFSALKADQYRFEFSKAENYGTYPIPGEIMNNIRAGKKVSTAGVIIQTYPTIPFWFLVVSPKSSVQGLETVLGKENASRLQAIIKKYNGG